MTVDSEVERAAAERLEPSRTTSGGYARHDVDRCRLAGRCLERFGGRMSSSDVLQAAADDFRFGWLRTLSGLITDLDEAIAQGDPAAESEAVARARELLAPPDPSTAFGARYLRALQDEPGVVLARRDLVAALGRP